MNDEIKEMLEFCDDEELVEDLSLPESLVLENAYSEDIRIQAHNKLGDSPTVHKFIKYCENIGK